MKLSIIAISLFALALISCDGNKKAHNETTSENIETELAETNETITEKYWKLITLGGHEVIMEENQEREIFFVLKAEYNTVAGFAGCNSITGEFDLEKGNRISFKNMDITMMICPDLEANETGLMEVFDLADNFRIHNDTLELNIGRRAPLAVFAAVYF